LEKQAGGGDGSRAGWSRSQWQRDDVDLATGMKEWRFARRRRGFILLPLTLESATLAARKTPRRIMTATAPMMKATIRRAKAAHKQAILTCMKTVPPTRCGKLT